jgi:DNA invertase Pin-like site-specific DNA recombinase
VTTYAFVYGRASSDPDDLKISVDSQLKKGVRYAAEHWPDAEVHTFRDDDITAAEPGVIRPDFERMLRELRSYPKGSVVGIWANEQSRLTRLGETSWDDLRVILNMAGLVEVHTGLQGVIGIAPGNSLAGRIYAVVDSEFAERTKVKVQDRHAELFAEGRPSGRAPFGYQSAKDDDKRPTYVQDPDAAPWVKKIFEWALQGTAIQVIADKLNAEGVPPRAASFKFKKKPRTVTTWAPGTVRGVLTAPTMAGLRGHTDENGVLHTVPAKWEPIVDEDTWRKVQRMLGQPTTVTGADGAQYRVRTKAAPTPRKYLLSGGRRGGEAHGVLRCGKCGHPLVAQTQGRPGGVRVPAYQCHPKGHPDACGGVSISPADQVETTVVTAIQAELARSPKLRKRLSAGTDAEVARWRTERDAAKARMLDAATLRGAGDLDDDEFRAMRGAAKVRYDAAEARLAAMTSDRDLPSVDDVVNRWDSLTLAAQRGVVERLIERIDVAPGHQGHPGFNRARLGTPKWRA